MEDYCDSGNFILFLNGKQDDDFDIDTVTEFRQLKDGFYDGEYLEDEREYLHHLRLRCLDHINNGGSIRELYLEVDDIEGLINDFRSFNIWIESLEL